MADDDAGLALVRSIKPIAEKVFTDLLGEVAIGITRVDGEYGLKVNLSQPPDPSVVLPHAVQGVPVKIEVTGRITKRKSGSA